MKSIYRKIRFFRALAFVSAGVGLLFLALAGTAQADGIDDYISAQMAWQRIPGLSIAVVKDGKIIKAKGYGLANVETASPATPATAYKIGSVSKQFLAAGIMLLVNEGKIRLDDSVSKYLDTSPALWRGITVRHLLTHTSGIVRDSPDFDPFKVQPDAEIIRSVYALPLRFAPGERWAYSNLNYYGLAEIVSRVTGKPWTQFIADRIFAPLGMASTRTTTTTEIVLQRASGYTAVEGALLNAESWLALRPSGAFLSTVLDLAKWDASLYDDTILDSASRTQMWSPVRLNDGKAYGYGFGWFVDSSQGHKHVYHSGGLPGFVCQFDRFVDDRLTVILIANIGNRDLKDVAVNLAAFYVPALRPTGEKSISDTEPQVTGQVRSMMVDLAKGNLDPNIFTAEMAAYLTGLLKSGAFNALPHFGRLRALTLIERKDNGDGRAYRYQLTYRSISLFVECTIDKSGKIAKFGLHD